MGKAIVARQQDSGDLADEFEKLGVFQDDIHLRLLLLSLSGLFHSKFTE